MVSDLVESLGKVQYTDAYWWPHLEWTPAAVSHRTIAHGSRARDGIEACYCWHASPAAAYDMFHDLRCHTGKANGSVVCRDVTLAFLDDCCYICILPVLRNAALGEWFPEFCVGDIMMSDSRWNLHSVYAPVTLGSDYWMIIKLAGRTRFFQLSCDLQIRFSSKTGLRLYMPLWH